MSSAAVRHLRPRPDDSGRIYQVTLYLTEYEKLYFEAYIRELARDVGYDAAFGAILTGSIPPLDQWESKPRGYDWTPCVRCDRPKMRPGRLNPACCCDCDPS